jgi:Amt family ammonium transporter
MTKTLRFLSLILLSAFVFGGAVSHGTPAFAQAKKAAIEKPVAAKEKPGNKAEKAREGDAAPVEEEAPGKPVEIGINAELAYILNSFMFLICGALVMWMVAGFTMLEAGLVRARNTSAICLKSLVIYALAGPLYYLIGYNVMYGDLASHGLWGSFTAFYNPAASELALMAADKGLEPFLTTSVVAAAAHSSMSEWFFQMVFVAVAASIVSGTLAERIKLWPFLLFVCVFTAFIYPIQGAWSWGGGWLSEVGGGFKDFAGSTLVHSVGGWAALTGAIILGPRAGKYMADGGIHPLPGSNLPLATLGTFILWFGWFGFTGASVLAMDSAKAITTMSVVFANTNLAACGGTIAAMIYAAFRYGKPDLTIVLNGALAGLVAITAGPDIASPLVALVIGAIGGILCSAAIPMFDKLKIDDVVGALSVHLVPGIWGTFAVALFTTGDYEAQLTGIAATAAFVCISSAIVWLFLKHTIGIRLDEKDERLGSDITEIGLEAYPEFEKRSA